MHRREFARSALITAAGYSRIVGANERIRLGYIGVGNRGALKTEDYLKWDARTERFTNNEARMLSITRRSFSSGILAPVLTSAPPGRRGRSVWYYVRVYQTNGHQAWSSPIWMEG